jgi:L-lactate utilization protein LutB
MNEEKLKKLAENFKLRNMEVEYFESFEAAKSYILNIVPIESTIGIGHSATLQKMNITNSLLKRGNVVYDKELAKNRDESKEFKRKALTTDWYITGSNAISVDGRIVNVDHSGNRVASITFGPDKVIIVVGKNKIVNSVEEAIKRVKNVAGPLNAKRAGLNPPCVTLNRCVDCVSKERVCNSLSIIEGQSDCNRIKVFIVNEECGF